MDDVKNRPYVLISSDAHAGADLLDYRPYLEKQFRDEFDSWAKSFREDAWGRFDMTMGEKNTDEDPNLRIGVSSFGSLYNWDSRQRLEHMDGDGIAAEIVFPNTVPPFYPRGIINAPGPATAEEYRLRWAGVKAHNRWLVDFCSQAPGRRGGLAQVFLNNVDDAVAEARWARESGLIGMLVPSDHTLKLANLYERRLDPFWAACVDVNLPVARHPIFVGPPETEETGPATDALGMYEAIPIFFRRGLIHLIMGGVFARYPDLKVIFTETRTGWFPEELEGMNAWYAQATTEGTHANAWSEGAVKALTKKPSDYFHTNCWIGASVMTRVDVENRRTLGVDRIVWGSDYPHHEGSWPHTDLAMRWIFSDVPEDEVRAMTSENAAKVYDLDLDFLQKIADKIGPTPEQVAKPITLDELPHASKCITIAEAIDTVSGSGSPTWP
jgi:predicted TIM-barrel fold metal-dependent hydrolase